MDYRPRLNDTTAMSARSYFDLRRLQGRPGQGSFLYSTFAVACRVHASVGELWLELGSAFCEHWRQRGVCERPSGQDRQVRAGLYMRLNVDSHMHRL